MPTVPTNNRFPFLDPELDRAALLPVAVDPQGEVVPAVPGVLAEALRALTLPARAMEGSVDPTSVRGIQEAANLAGGITLTPIRGPVAALGSRAILPRSTQSLREMRRFAESDAGFDFRFQSSVVGAQSARDLRKIIHADLPPEIEDRVVQFLSTRRYTPADIAAKRKVYSIEDQQRLKALRDAVETGESSAVERAMSSIVQDEISSALELIDTLRGASSRAEIATRLRRRKQQGFEGVFYHGTDRDFAAFDIAQNRLGEEAVFFSPSPEVAKYYGHRLVEATLRADNPAVIDLNAIAGRPKHYSSLLVRETIKAAKDAGKDVVVLQNVKDIGGLQDQVLVLDPKKIRSTRAEFGDPSSSNLLAGFTGAAVAAPFVARAFSEPTLGDTEQ